MSQTNDVSSINAKGHCCSCVLLSDLVLAPDTKFGDIPSMKEAHKLGRFNILLRVALTIILLLVAESSTVSGTDHIGDIAAPPSSVGYAYDTSPSPLSSLNGILGTKPSLDDLNLYILSFARVVFEPENHNRYPWILKWPERVEIRLRGKIEPRHSDLLQQVVGDLSRITGMPFVVDGPSDDLLDTPFGFNARFRDELLNGEIFYTLEEAKIIIEQWRKHYNTKRPHGALGYRPPAPETIVQMDQRPIMH